MDLGGLGFIEKEGLSIFTGGGDGLDNLPPLSLSSKALKNRMLLGRRSALADVHDVAFGTPPPAHTLAAHPLTQHAESFPR